MARARRSTAGRCAPANGHPPSRALLSRPAGGLDRDEIRVVYQPQFAAEDDRLVGAEALALGGIRNRKTRFVYQNGSP